MYAFGISFLLSARQKKGAKKSAPRANTPPLGPVSRRECLQGFGIPDSTRCGETGPSPSPPVARGAPPTMSVKGYLALPRFDLHRSEVLDPEVAFDPDADFGKECGEDVFTVIGRAHPVCHHVFDTLLAFGEVFAEGSVIAPTVAGLRRKSGVTRVLNALLRPFAFW